MKEISQTSDEYVQFPFLKEIDNEWKYDFPKNNRRIFTECVPPPLYMLQFDLCAIEPLRTKPQNTVTLLKQGGVVMFHSKWK